MEVLLQNENTECGYISLLMILDYFGCKTDINSLKYKYPISNEGSSFEDLISIATIFGLDAEAYSVEQNEIDTIKLPAILQLYGSHFVVIEKITSKDMTIIDPAFGRKKISRLELSRHIGFGEPCYFLEFEKSSKFIERDDRKKFTIFDIVKNIKEIKKFYINILFFAVIMQIVTILSPLYIQFSLDEVVSAKKYNLLTILLIGFVFIYLLDVAIRYIKENILIYMQSKVNPNLSYKLFKRLVHLPLVFFQNRTSGNLSNKFVALEKIILTITKTSPNILINLITIVALFFAMLYLNIILTLIVVSIISLYLIVSYIHYSKIIRLNSEFWEESGKEKSVLIDSIKNIKAIKLFTSEKNTIDKFKITTYKKYSIDNKMNKLNIYSSSFEQIISHADTLIIIYIGTQMIISNSFTVGMFYSFIFYKNIFARSFASAINDFFEIKTLKSELQYLKDIFTEKEEKYEIENNIFIKDKDKCDFFKQDIKFENFNFSYNELSQNIFSRFNLLIKENESLCILGESGCGKTTILNSLVRLHDINKGEIFIGNRDILSIPINELRENISYMSTEEIFLDKNIIENITLSKVNPDIKKIISILKGVGLYELITNDLFGGLENYLGSVENRFSTGQKQRILLARALYKNSCLLLLDEPTSALDLETEKKVMEYLISLKRRVIIVTHRESVAKYFANIIRL